MPGQDLLSECLFGLPQPSEFVPETLNLELEVRVAGGVVKKKRLREIEKEREIRREFEGIDMIFEAGRRSVLDKRNKYERKRYAARKREREAKKRLTMNGT